MGGGVGVVNAVSPLVSVEFLAEFFLLPVKVS